MQFNVFFKFNFIKSHMIKNVFNHIQLPSANYPQMYTLPLPIQLHAFFFSLNLSG